MRIGISKVTLVGNVGYDPKVSQINDDLKVARFPLATNELSLSYIIFSLFQSIS